MTFITRFCALLGVGLTAALLHSWAWELTPPAPEVSTEGATLELPPDWRRSLDEASRDNDPSDADPSDATTTEQDPTPEEPVDDQPDDLQPVAADDPCADIDFNDIPVEMTLEQARCFHALFEAGQPVVFLDARDNLDLYTEAHIPGAIRLSATMVLDGDPVWFDFFSMNHPPEFNEWIIIYCTGGDCDESHNLRDQLANYGYTATYIFVGGMEEWTAASLPVIQGDAP